MDDNPKLNEKKASDFTYFKDGKIDKLPSF